MKNKILCLGMIVISFLFCGCKQGVDIMVADELQDQKNATTIEAIEGETRQQLEERMTSQEFICVYVCGQVQTPGVYTLNSTARMNDAIELAGGFTKDADTTFINLAEFVADGQKIYVPSIGEMMTEIATEEEQAGLVDINQAELNDFMTLPGIGEAKAKLIIEYRTEHGLFHSVEDLMMIPGIKEGVFNKIREYIKV